MNSIVRHSGRGVAVRCGTVCCSVAAMVLRCARRVGCSDHADLRGVQSSRHHLNYEVVLAPSTKRARTSAETAQHNSKGSAPHSTHARSAIRRGWSTTPWDSGNCAVAEMHRNSKEDIGKQGARTLVTQQEDLRSSNWWTKECYDLNTVSASADVRFDVCPRILWGVCKQ